MNTKRQRVSEIAAEIIRANPSGVRWSELTRSVFKALPDENTNTIRGALHHFQNNLPTGFTRPERGVYAFGNPLAEALPESAYEVPVTALREQDFYEPFADWLKGDLEEATTAKALGGNAAGGKWGTPDVIGLYRPRKTDPIQFTEEVIAAEIKIANEQLIVAFGQACAYKLFAHRVYIVVPSTAKELKRLDALSSVVGIGLVTFSPLDPRNPKFTVMTRAAKHEPDYFYTNQVLSQFKDVLEL